MKIILRPKENIYDSMRKCGYHYKREKEVASQPSFVKRLSSSDYPRFHAYIKINLVSDETEINLHLDQKKPVYRGVSAHSGEYDGELVEKEAERIKQILGL